jgi:ABC-type transport system substrate-binding protein
MSMCVLVFSLPSRNKVKIKKGKGKMNLKIFPIALVLVLLFSILLPIASVGSQGIPNPDHIYYATTRMIETVDPHWAYDRASRELIQNVYEPLCMFNETAVGQFIALLADQWPGYSEDPSNCIIPSLPDPLAPQDTNQTWYFHIRTGVPWQSKHHRRRVFI